jgi:hypothetical protein
LKPVKLTASVEKAEQTAEKEMVKGKNADEFLEKVDRGGLKMYVDVAQTLPKNGPTGFHQNARCFHVYT